MTAEHPPAEEDEAQDRAVDAYWATARKRIGLTELSGVLAEQPLGAVEPPAWSFGADPEEADELLDLVLAGVKTATTSAVASYEAEDVPLPSPGDLSILLDGRGRPRALIVTTEVRVCRFDEVDAEHVAAEGEGYGSLADWQTVHAKVFTDELATVGQEFTESSAVVLEHFRRLDP